MKNKYGIEYKRWPYVYFEFYGCGTFSLYIWRYDAETMEQAKYSGDVVKARYLNFLRCSLCFEWVLEDSK